MKTLFAVALITLAGCSGQARTEYYNAIAEANKAQAAAYQAKADALRAVAVADPDSAGAVAMALALSGVQTVAPSYIESDAVAWGKILASPVAALGGAYIAADVAKEGINAEKEIQIASQQTTAAMVTGVAQAGGASTNQAVDTLAGVIAGQGTNLVTVATEGLQSTAGVADTGFSTVDSVTSNGLDTVNGAVAQLGNVSSTAINANTAIAGEGFNTVETVALDNNALIGAVVADNNSTIVELSQTLQPIVPVEIVTPTVIQPVVEIQPTVIQPVVTPQ